MLLVRYSEGSYSRFSWFHLHSYSIAHRQELMDAMHVVPMVFENSVLFSGVGTILQLETFTFNCFEFESILSMAI